MLVTAGMSQANRDRLGLAANWKHPGLTDEHQTYLEFHRGHVFRQ